MKLLFTTEPCDSIEDSCRCAQDFADKLGSNVEFEFNGILCIAQPGGDAGVLCERQMQALNSTPTVYSNGAPE